MRETVRVGMVGAGFMARAHTLALNNLAGVYWPSAPRVMKIRLADLTQEVAEQAAERWGWEDATADWTRITRADDIDLVDIVTPNDAHAEVAIDAARHGKHVLCEKPLAADVDSARAMYHAVAGAGVTHQVGFVYRSWPAVQLAKRLIDQGELGRLLHFRGWFLQDYALDALLPMVWRLQRERAGAGSLGDTGSHLIDIARFLVGDVTRVMARARTFIDERPVATVATSEASFRRESGRVGGASARVEVDDAADLLLELGPATIGAIHTNWTAAGHKVDLGFEVGGNSGAVRFSWLRPNELEFYSAGDHEDRRGFRSIVVGPQHAGAAELWPVAGQGLGYGDAFLIALRGLVDAIGRGQPATPDFLDGLRASEVIDAALRSHEAEAWIQVEYSSPPATRQPPAQNPG